MAIIRDEDLFPRESAYDRIRRESGLLDNKEEEVGYLGAALKGAKANAAGVLGGQAYAADALLGVGGGMGDYMNQVAQNNARPQEYSYNEMIPFESDYWTNPYGAAYDIGGGLGSTAALLGEGALLNAAGVGGAAGAIGAKIASRLPQVAGAVQKVAGTPMGKVLAANVASTIPEALSEGGNKAHDIKENGGSEEEVRKGLAQSFLLNTGVLGASKVAESVGLGKLLTNPSAKAAITKGLIGGAGENAWEEAAQTGIENYVGNPNGNLTSIVNPYEWNEEQKNAAAIGAVTGGVMGGVGAGGGRLLNNYANKYRRTDEPEREQNDERERFINAVSGQESNGDYTAVNERTGASGKYQIMPENWSAWAKEAGLDPNAEMTPENQEIVARHKLGEYYDKYGAAGAAQAWYAGEGSFDYDEEALNRKQGNGDEPSIREYVESVMQRMGNTSSEDNTETVQDTFGEDYDESDNEFDKLAKKEKEESDTYLENADKESKSANEQNKGTAPKEEQAENKKEAETVEYVAEPKDAYYDDTENQAVQYPSYPKRDLNNKRIFALKQLYEKNKKSDIINGIIQKARNEQAERKQRELDYSWYLKESKRNQGSEQGVDEKLVQQALGDKRIEMLTDRAVGGDKSAQKAFENISSPAVREALLNRKVDNLLRENDIEEMRETQPFMPSDTVLENRRQQYNGKAQRALANQNKVQPDVLPSVEPTPRNSRAIDSRNMNEMIAASRKNVPETQLNKSNNLITKGNVIGAAGTAEGRNASRENMLKSVAERKQAKANTKQQETVEKTEERKEKPKKAVKKNTAETKKEKPKAESKESKEEVKEDNSNKSVKAELEEKGVKASVARISNGRFQVKTIGKQGEKQGEELKDVLKKTGLLDKLKKAGYRWQQKNQSWEADPTEEAKTIAEELGFKNLTDEYVKEEVDKIWQPKILKDTVTTKETVSSLVAFNEDNSEAGKRYTVSQDGYTVTVKDGVISVKEATKTKEPYNKETNFLHFDDIKVAEYQNAALESGNPNVGTMKFVQKKAYKAIYEWIEAEPKVKDIRKENIGDVANSARETASRINPAIRKALDKAGIEVADLITLRKRKNKAESQEKTNNNSNELVENNEQLSTEIQSLIDEENLKPEETKKYIENALQDGTVKTTGTEIDKLMPSISRFNNSGRTEKKATVTRKIQDIFDKYLTVENKNAVSVEKNIANGKKAIEKVIKTHQDEENAMYREDVGNIDFVWGTEGRGAKFKGGYGIAHIIAKRNAEDGSGKKTANKLVEVIAKGKDTERQESANNDGQARLKIHYDGYTAVLSLKAGDKNTWLLTGWEDSETQKATVNASGEGYDSTTATTVTPTLTRHNGETAAFSKNSIPQKAEESKKAEEVNEVATKKAEADIEAAKPNEETSKELPRIQFGVIYNDGKPRIEAGFYKEKYSDIINKLKNAGWDLKEENLKTGDYVLCSSPLTEKSFKLAQSISSIKEIQVETRWKKKQSFDGYTENLDDIKDYYDMYTLSEKLEKEKITADVVFSDERNRYEIKFWGTPSKEIRDTLKDANFWWDNERRVWYNSKKSSLKRAKELVAELGYKEPETTLDELEKPTSNLDNDVIEYTQNENEEGNDNGINSAEKLHKEDTGNGRTRNQVRGTAESEEPSGSNGYGDSEAERGIRGTSRPDTGSGIHGSGATVSGKNAVRRSSVESPRVETSSARSAELSGSVVDSLRGKPHDDRTTIEDVGQIVEDRQTNGAVTRRIDEIIKENKLTEKRASRLRRTAKAMPFLNRIQLYNTDFIAERLEENKKQGVMVTDGTGTGKTFSGLAVAKQLLDEGKENILIVTPSDGINDQWIKAAEERFDIDLSKLENTNDSGKGVVITTYANFGSNNALINRKWDLVIADEAHNLMNNEAGNKTAVLEKLRTLTLHHASLRNRAIHIIAPKVIEARETIAKANALEKKRKALTDKEQAIINEAESLRAENADQLTNEELKKVDELEKDLKGVTEAEKPKVMFLSATPFAYVADIDYAEGYLFDYPDDSNGTHHSGHQQFMMEHFGYRMRYGKLTKPDVKVDTSVNEIEFHEWLRKTGALTGHELEIDKDYNRGFLLVNQGIGAKIDEGFSYLRENSKKYKKILDVLENQFDARKRNYLLESIKARESIPLIKEYLKAGKKVVVFYETNVARESFNPFKLQPETAIRLKESKNEDYYAVAEEMETLKKERPDLVDLNLNNLREPIAVYREAFGEDAMFYNGLESKKKRAEYVKAFNSDDSGKNLIFVQQDAGNAGLSLHDTTGKYQRVLINIGIPRRPSYAIQIEGRIYRQGNMSNAIIRYLTTNTNIEKQLFASTIASRASTAENLALGKMARGLRDSFKNAYEEVFNGDWEQRKIGAVGEDVGGKANDRMLVSNQSDYERAKSLYYTNAKKNSKIKSAEGVDYYATPEPVGYKMVQWANVHDGDKVLEPSAGHGAISRFFNPNTDNTIVEPSMKLAPIAQMRTEGAKLINGTFEDLHIGNKYDAVVMNPPYGTGGKVAMEHLAKAFNHLKENGRVIAIIPRGMCDKRFDKWYESDEAKNAHLVAEVDLPSVTFGRAGTKVSTRIVVIDKNLVETRKQPPKQIDLSNITDIDELFDSLENVEMPKRNTKTADEVKREKKLEEAKQSFGTDKQVFGRSFFIHTKTKEKIPFSDIKKPLDYNTFSKINKIAKQHSGYYSSYAKGFLFETEDARDDFIVEATEEAKNSKYSVADTEVFERSREEVETEIKKALPNAEINSQSDGSYIAVMPNGKQLMITIDDKIILNESEAETARKAHNTKVTEVEGYWSKWEKLDGNDIDGVLHVSRNSRAGTAFHETLHAAMDLCLTGKEKDALYKYFKKLAEKSSRSIDEEIADGYKEWVLRQQATGKSSGLMSKLYRKVKEFLGRIAEMLNGTKEIHDTFRKLESGEAWTRKGVNQRSGGSKLFSSFSKEEIKYSVAPKDERAEEKTMTRQQLQKIANEIVHTYIGKKLRRYYEAYNEKAKAGIVRSQGRIEELSAVIGMHIDAEKGISKKNNLLKKELIDGAMTREDVNDTLGEEEKVKMGVADFAEKYVTDKESAAVDYPKYFKIFETSVNNDPALKAKLNKFTNAVKLWNKQTPEARTAAGITRKATRKPLNSKEDFKAYLEDKLDYLTTEWSDDKNPLLKIERELEAITGKEISVDESAYYQARMANSSAASRIQMAIRGDKKNRKHWYDALNDVFNGQWKEDVSFQDIVDKVGEFDKLATSDKEAKDYLDKNNFKNGLDILSAYLLSNRYLEIWEKNPGYKASVSKADAMATVESTPKAIKEAAELYYKFDQNLVNILHDSGMLNDKAYETISKYTRYCPLFRDFSDEAAFNKFINRLGGANSYINLANGIKALTDVGSDRTVLDDPVKSMLRMTSSIIRKAEKNKVAQKFVAMSERSGVGKFVVPEFDAMGVQQKSADPQQSIFTVWRNGKQQAFRTTADIYELLEGNDNYSSGLVDVLDNMVSRSAAKTLRIGATSSIPFMLANATKDTITAAFNSKNGFIPIIDTFRGIKLLAADPKFRATFESSGVGMSSIYKEDPDSLQDTLDKMAGNKWWQKFTPTKLAHTMLDHYLHYAELLENGARAGEFARALENNRSLLEAAISAKEVSTDFSRAGKSGRVANRIIPFFNAVIQGNTAVIRALRKPNAWKVGAGLAIATAVLWSINKDEPWYEDLTLEEKLGAWHFGIGDGKHISIPKPEMYGLIFGGAVEAALEQAYEKDPKAVKGWTDRFTAQTLPSFIPALYRPILEVVANYDFYFKNPVVSRRLQNLPKELQIGSTTSEIAKGIGKVTAPVGLSPVEVDHLIRGYFGSAGTYVTKSLMNPLLRESTAPATDWFEDVGLNRFIKNDFARSRYIDEWYELKSELDKKHTGYGTKGKPATYIQGANKVSKKMSEINKFIRETRANPRISPEKKRKLIDNANMRARETARLGVKTYSKYLEK